MAETNLKQVAVGLRELNDTTKSGDKATTTQLTNLNKNMEKFLKSFAGAKLDDEEKRRDDKKGKGDKPKSSPIKGFQKDDFTGGMGIAGFALTLGAAVAGFVTGVATWLGGFASKLLKGTWIDKATAGFRSSIAKGVKSLSRNLKNVSNAFMAGTRGFKSMGKGVNGAFKPMGTMSKIMNGIGKGIRFLLTPFRAVGKSLESSKKAGGLLAKITATFKNLFAGPTKLLSGFGNMFSKGGTLGKVFSAFKTFGTKIPIVGQVITGLLGLFDGFMGFKKQEGGFGKKMTRGIVDFLGSLAKNIIGGLFDIIFWIPKKIIGFVSKTLGFEDFGKMVSDFSLMDLIGGLLW